MIKATNDFNDDPLFHGICFFHRTMRKSCLGHRWSTRQNATRLDTRSDAFGRSVMILRVYGRNDDRFLGPFPDLFRSETKNTLERRVQTVCRVKDTSLNVYCRRFFFFFSIRVCIIVVRLRSTASHARTSTPRESHSVRTQHPQ